MTELFIPGKSTDVAVPEKCRVCSCTEKAPCVMEDDRGRTVTCAWFDFDHTLCTNLRCIAVVPLEILEQLVYVGRR